MMLFRSLRDKFKVFDSLKTPHSSAHIEAIADEIMTLSLTQLADLAKLINEKESGNFFPLQETVLLSNRSPFPHPKHVFSGMDAEQRPGMRTHPQAGPHT